MAGAALALATAGLAACSSASSSSTAGNAASSHPASSASTAPVIPIETLYGQVTGSAAAKQLNSTNTPLTFPSFTYNGVVKLTVAPFTLPGGPGPSGTDTLPGGLRVHHVSSLPASVNSGKTPPPAVWTYTGGRCHYVATFDKGVYTVVPGSTGKFAGAAGHGTYNIIATGYAPATMNDKPVAGVAGCSFTTIGATSASGASITFTASGPLAVTMATSAGYVTGKMPV